ncbi:hypothetical protein cypCar_00017644, partial [Cyprinus carpio]
ISDYKTVKNMDVFGGAPRVLGYPRPVLVKCGTDAVLKCQIGGDPQPDVIWERKNESILPDGRYRITQDGKVYSLYISGVTMEDAGQYICRANNNIGETYAAASLKVEEEPQELQQTQPAPPPPQQNEVKVIPPEQEIKIINQQQDGVVQKADPFQDNKPRFLIKPLSLRVDRGEDAAFSCKLSGDPLPQVVWEKDGKQLNDIYESSHYHVGQQDGGWFQLKIFRTRAPDGGVYMCKAVNKYGEAMTGAVLLVEPIPEQREGSKTNGYTNGHYSPHQLRAKHSKEPHLNVSKAKKFTVTEGKHAKFRCYVTGKPKPEIVWKKDGENIVPGRRFLIFEDREGYYTLKVLYCKQQDTGLYICAASNALGNTLSAVQLSVKGPPVRFKRALLDAEVRERDVAVLECEVPEESISTAWYLEDQKLQPGNKYNMEQKGTRRRLTIQNVGADDDGVYLCEMPDGGKTIAELAVKGTIVKKLPRRLEVMEGENAAFFVEVEQDDMDICWFKDGLQLQETHQTIIKSFGKTHILVFVDTSYQDSGTITFMAGRSITNSKLRVKTARHCPPICPVSVQMNTDSLNGAILSWSASPNLQNSTKSVYVLERQEVGSQEWQRCLTTETATSAEVLGDSVPCEGDYRFRICCVNKYGRSGHVEFPKVVHLAPGPKIKTPLKNAVVTEGEDAVFSIELSANLIGTWFLNSQQLQDSGRFSITQSKNQHTLRIQQVPNVYDGAEITFIATGVRDSATLQIKAAFEDKFLPMSDMDTKKTIEVGNPIVLYCEVSHPTANVQWFKDGQELHVEEGLNIQSDGNMRRIVIQSAEYFHSGVYTCKSNNDILTFNVNIEAPPVSFKEITQEERQKSAMELDPVVLTCELSRPDEPANWFKDGVAVLQSDNITIQSEGTMKRLIIRSAALPDAGTYTCQAGDQTMSFTVNIKEPPVTIVDPKDDIHMEHYVSEEVVLNCELSRSNGEAHWFKDGLKLQESENVRLSAEGPYRRVIILCASKRDSGEYVCDTGGDSIFFQLIITEAPVRIVSPRESEVDVCILSSEKLVLSCEISKADAEVCWFCDGMEVEENDNLKLEDEGMYRRLVIPCATIDDSAEYVCETADDSVTFWVKVEEPPVKLSCSKKTGSIAESFAGELVVLELEVSRDNAEVCWMKDGVKLEESNNITITENGLIRKLTIHFPTLKDSGIYTCNAIDDTIDFKVKITEAPVKILNKDQIKSEHKVALHDDVVLECELSTANGVVNWYKNGSPIEENERFCFEEEGAFRTLVILCAELQDSGEYILDAKDDSISFHVTVKEPSVKIIGNSGDPDYQEMVTGDDLILACEVSRANAPVTWLFNNKPLVPDERTHIESSGTLRKLTLSNIHLSDSGKYMCDAVDDQMITTVKVQEPPVEFLNKEEPNLVTGYEAEAVTLTAMVSRPNAIVRWLKDWTPVSDERFHIASLGLTRTFTINPLKKLDSGEYTCDANTDDMHFSLLVKDMRIKFVKPLADTVAHKDVPRVVEFLTELHNTTVMESEDATFKCVVSPDDVQLVWLMDGEPIKPSDRFHIEHNSLCHTLIIRKVQLLDSSRITAEAEGIISKASLKVQEAQVLFTKRMEAVMAEEFGEAVLETEVSLESGEVQWMRQGVVIQPGPRHKLTQNGCKRILTITNLSLSDRGTYRCETLHDRTQVKLNVEQTPVTIIKKLSDVRFEEESAVILECEMSRPNVDVRWLKNGLELKSSKTLRIYSMGRKRCLQILECSIGDSGLYTCEIGDLSTSCKLEVYEHELEIITGLEDLWIKEDQNAVFMCELSMEDMPGEWYKNGSRIRPTSTIKTRTEGTKHFLLICNVKPEDSGEIKFVSKQVESVASLEVEELPVSIVRPLRDRTALEKHRVILECTVSSTNCDATWYKGDQELESTEHMEIIQEGCYHKLVIHQVALEDEGTYSIEVGEHISTAKLMVEAQSILVVKDIEDVEVRAPEMACFQCEVSVTLIKPPIWTLNGETLQSGPTVRIENQGTVHKLTFKKTSSEMSGTVRFTTGKAKTSAKLTVL